MKILHVAETIKGGVATVLRQLITSQQLNNKVIVLIPDSQSSELDEKEGYQQKLFKRTGRNLRSFISLFINFTLLFIKEKPDIVHIHSTFAGVICRFSLILLYPFKRTKVIYCPHAFSFLMSDSETKCKKYATIEKLFQVITDKIICVSNYEYNQAIKFGLNKNKLEVIYNGVPEIDWQAKITKDNPFINNTKVNLLFIGRFDYQKGFDILSDVMPNITNCNLTAIGNFVREKVKVGDDKMNITYKGWMNYDEIIPYLYFCDAIIIPSRWEGFAMVPLEAMSFAKPVIAADTTSLPEVVDNNKTGYLFSLNDQTYLTDLLNNLDHSHLKELGINGYRKYKNSFTSEKMLSNVINLYHNVLKNHE